MTSRPFPWTAIMLTTVSGMAATLGAVRYCFAIDTLGRRTVHLLPCLTIELRAGGLIVVLIGKPSPVVLGHLLSFAAGVMMFISFGDLLPDAARELHSSFWAHTYVRDDFGIACHRSRSAGIIQFEQRPFVCYRCFAVWLGSVSSFGWSRSRSLI